MPLLQCQRRPPEAHTAHQFDGDMEVCAAIGVSFLRDDDELKQNAVAIARPVGRRARQRQRIGEGIANHTFNIMPCERLQIATAGRNRTTGWSTAPLAKIRYTDCVVRTDAPTHMRTSNRLNKEVGTTPATI